MYKLYSYFYALGHMIKHNETQKLIFILVPWVFVYEHNLYTGNLGLCAFRWEGEQQ